MTNAAQLERLTDTLALLGIPGVGRIRYARLVRQFGSPVQALEASVDDLASVDGISSQLAQTVKSQCDWDTAKRTAAEIIKLGWGVLYQDSAEFPALLQRIADPPVLLFQLGAAWQPEDRLIAMVGTRHPTEAGRRFATTLAGELAEAGLGVVSGMAEGIDSCAHRGALARNGKTVAVWGRPLNVVFPPLNRSLAEEIEQKGTIYSEYLPGEPYSQANFPERNRIISGLCEATIVVEAGEKSGALITAGYALEQGRELFAVPGAPGVAQSAGTNELIKRGARMLTRLQDIFDELPRLRGAVVARQAVERENLTDSEQKVIELLVDGPLQIDTLARQAAMSVPEAMEYLLALELKGLVQELSGKRYVLCE